MKALQTSEFEYVRRLIRDQCGIWLNEGQEYLVDLRLTTLAVQEGLASPQALIQQLVKHSEPALIRKVVDAMTTNETSFFRDLKPFEFLRKELLPQLSLRRSPLRELKIWSAACSTGQEPYSIAMLLHEHFPTLIQHWRIELLASDISFTCLEVARSGIYNQFHVNRGLPVNYLLRYFEKQGAAWHLTPRIRDSVRFLEMNLLGSWQELPQMDIIFLSNVLMYFSPETKRQILKRVRHQLKPDGYLFLGGSENPFHIDSAFERMDSAENANCYRLIRA